MAEQLIKVLMDELETSDYDIFHEVSYKGERFTGIGYENSSNLYSEYCYKDGYGHGKCFTVSAAGQKTEEFELNEGEYIGEGYAWYQNGQLKEYNRYTPTRLTRKWSESGILLLEDDKDMKVRKEYYSTGELKLEYIKPVECICYSKNGMWIYKHKYESGKEWLVFDKAYFVFNELYIEENYYELLYEDSLLNYIFLWLIDVLTFNNKKAKKIICKLINHENLHVKDKAIFISGENHIKEAKLYLIKALLDKRIPPKENDFINGGSTMYTRTISQQAKIAIFKLVRIIN